MRYIYIALCLAISPVFSSAYADTKEIVPKDETGKQTEANVYFTSEVSSTSISDLMVVLERVRINYPKIEKVNLLINSPGGDGYAGMQAYWNLKSYPLPIHAFNVGNVSSAATFLFCAVGERSSVPNGTFVLHPAEWYLSGPVKPDVIERTRDYLHSINMFAENVYSKCTNLDDDDLKGMLKAEYNSKFLDNKQAEKIALTNNTIEKIPQPAASFFVQERGGA